MAKKKNIGIYVVLGIGLVIGIGYTAMSCAWGDCWLDKISDKVKNANKSVDTRTTPVAIK